MKLNSAIIAFIIFNLYANATCQVLDFSKHSGRKWPNHRIPYVISSDYTQDQRSTITGAIQTWNSMINNLKLTPRNQEEDYVYVYPGPGCWSYLGRMGGQQPISLQSNGCVYRGTPLHQFMHAAGFTHEQNRLDRDEFIEMLWYNISEDWRGQYEKINQGDFIDIGSYDYYSIMHYPVNAPDTNKKAFTPKTAGIDQNRIGNRDYLTDTDISKIESTYQ